MLLDVLARQDLDALKKKQKAQVTNVNEIE